MAFRPGRSRPTQQERAIIVQELAKLDLDPAALAGARTAAKVQPYDVASGSIDTSLAPEHAKEVVLQMLGNIGEPCAEMGSQVIVGTGRNKTNPSVVSADVFANGPGSTVSVRAVAAEGLIKRHCGREALETAMKELKSLLSPM